LSRCGDNACDGARPLATVLSRRPRDRKGGAQWSSSRSFPSPSWSAVLPASGWPGPRCGRTEVIPGDRPAADALHRTPHRPLVPRLRRADRTGRSLRTQRARLPAVSRAALQRRATLRTETRT
jgi:hypothetical protein